MPTDYDSIYRDRAADYERLVTREDADGNLRALLERIAAPAGKDVVEFGAGTGRLTRWVVAKARSVHAYDASAAMLEVARRSLVATGRGNWCVRQARHDEVPVEAERVDVALAGWTFGHEVARHPDGWKDIIGGNIATMRECLRPGGRCVIIETLGTGREEPEAPTPGLAEYYEWLRRRGFHEEWVRTDYLFASVDEAVELIGFFFGEALADRVRAAGSPRVPECTGLWWREEPQASQTDD